MAALSSLQALLPSRAFNLRWGLTFDHGARWKFCALRVILLLLLLLAFSYFDVRKYQQLP